MHREAQTLMQVHNSLASIIVVCAHVISQAFSLKPPLHASKDRPGGRSNISARYISFLVYRHLMFFIKCFFHFIPISIARALLSHFFNVKDTILSRPGV